LKKNDSELHAYQTIKTVAKLCTAPRFALLNFLNNLTALLKQTLTMMRNSPGAESLPGCPKIPNNVTNTLQHDKFASDRPQVRTWGSQTCFLPRAPSNLVTPLVDGKCKPLPTHHLPTGDSKQQSQDTTDM